MARTKDTLKLIGARFGISEQAVEAFEKDQALLDRPAADQDSLLRCSRSIQRRPFFVNGERLKGAMPFEELKDRSSRC